MKTAIVGGGAAGFFLAINLKELCPQMEVTILERGSRVLRKVEVSGGGRCNCTNTFGATERTKSHGEATERTRMDTEWRRSHGKDTEWTRMSTDGFSLSSVYPRGHRLMQRLFRQFSPQDAFRWFESRGVPLTIQADGCVFPQSQDSHTIINMFLSEARRLGVTIRTNTPVNALEELADHDFIAITTGGINPQSSILNLPLGSAAWLVQESSIFNFQSSIVPPVPSLFTFSIADEGLHALMGTVVEHAQAMIPGTKLRASGPLLITHWGMSGPCILRLSSYAARELNEHGYRMPLSINWLAGASEKNNGHGMNTERTRKDTERTRMDTERTRKDTERTRMDTERTRKDTDFLMEYVMRHPQKQLSTVHPPELPQRLWAYLLEKHLGHRAHAPWDSLNQKEMNRLMNGLTNDQYEIAGRAPFKDEFVTCGGINLTAVDSNTLEYRLSPQQQAGNRHPRLFFAGEVLDIDGITGGFNFQAAWTTAYVVAKAISHASHDPQGEKTML